MQLDSLSFIVMRITIVQGAFLPVPPIRGGAVEKIWFALGREFARRGHHVTHVSRSCGTLPPEEFTDGVHHIRVSGFDTPHSLVRLKWRDLLYTRRALRVLPEADILVTNTFWFPILSPARRLGKIYVHVARYPKGQMKLYGKASRLHAVSRPIEEAIRKEVPNLASRIRTIPYFVNSPAFQPLNNQRSKTILYVGRIHPEKGIHILVEAFERLLVDGMRDWSLRIVGPWETKLGGGGDRYFEGLRRRSHKLGNFVDWTGPVFDLESLDIYYRQSAMFVYPSLAEHGETFGLAPLEAMAAGCPPVVSSLECFQDFIKPDTNGWTFDHRKENAPENLARVLGRLVAQPDHLAKVGECAVRTAREYSLPKVTDLLLSDFEEILHQ
jgi:glycosyltransferase involved in cell wall biosynthesis